MYQRTTTFFRDLLRTLFHALGEALHKGAEIFVKHPLTRQKAIHALGMANRTQVSPEKNPVEPCYTSHDSVSVPFHKSLHDAPPIESANPIMRLASWGACFIWLRLCCAVPLWFVFPKQSLTTETQRTQRVHREETHGRWEELEMEEAS